MVLGTFKEKKNTALELTTCEWPINSLSFCGLTLLNLPGLARVNPRFELRKMGVDSNSFSWTRRGRNIAPNEAKKKIALN